MRASGQPTLPVVGLQQLNDFAVSYSAVNLDLKVANTRRSQLAQTRGRKVSAALARGGRRSPGTAAPHTKRPRARGEARAPFHSTYAEDGLVGEANTSTYLSPSPCYCAVLARLRRWTRFWPQVRHASPTAAHPSPPPPPGQHARVIGRVSVIPPNAAPSSMRLQECTDLRRLSVHQLQLQRTAKTPLTGSPRHPCVTPRSHGPLLPRRHREPQRPPTASCAMHCTPLCARPPQGHTHAAPAPPRPLVRSARAAPHEGTDAQAARWQVFLGKGRVATPSVG